MTSITTHEWQPIETAPIWVEVLVYYEGRTCYKSQPTKIGTSVQTYPGIWDLGSAPKQRKFLYWMHLPEPPNESKEN